MREKVLNSIQNGLILEHFIVLFLPGNPSSLTVVVPSEGVVPVPVAVVEAPD